MLPRVLPLESLKKVTAVTEPLCLLNHGSGKTQIQNPFTSPHAISQRESMRYLQLTLCNLWSSRMFRGRVDDKHDCPQELLPANAAPRARSRKVMEYDKTGQPWEFDSENMTWKEMHEVPQDQLMPKHPRQVIGDDYDDRTDASEFGHGPLTDSSMLTPRSVMNHQLTSDQAFSATEGLHRKGPSEIDSVISEVLQRQSARLSVQRIARPMTTGISAPILQSFDLMSSSSAGYAHLETPSIFPEQDLSRPKDSSKQLLHSMLTDLENTVKALDSPPICSDIYATEPLEQLMEEGKEDRQSTHVLDHVAKGEFLEFLSEEATVATITFRASELKYSGVGEPFLVFVQNSIPMGRTGAGNHEFCPLWQPMVLEFKDMWSPVSVQCWTSASGQVDNLIGENLVPVDDILTTQKEIHLMQSGQHAGQIIVHAVQLGEQRAISPSELQPEEKYDEASTRQVTSLASDDVALNHGCSQMDPSKGAWTLKVGLKSADHLPKMDMFGSCDPYVVLKAGLQQFTSRTIKGSYSPIWNQDFEFQIDPSRDYEDYLLLQVFGY